MPLKPRGFRAKSKKSRSLDFGLLLDIGQVVEVCKWGPWISWRWGKLWCFFHLKQPMERYVWWEGWWVFKKIVVTVYLIHSFVKELILRANDLSMVQNSWTPKMDIPMLNMGVSKNRGTPKWMVKIMENPIKMGWFGGPNPILKHPYYQLCGPFGTPILVWTIGMKLNNWDVDSVPGTEIWTCLFTLCLCIIFTCLLNMNVYIFF